MTISNVTHRAIATLKLPKNASAVVTFTAGVVKAMTGNPNFPTPSPALGVVQQAADALHAAETSAVAKVRGAAAQRNEMKRQLVTLLEGLRTYVQTQADASPENGPAIIQSAGLPLRKTQVRPHTGFRTKAGTVSGTVKIVAPTAARRGAYEWQYSTDGGKTWITMPSTLQAKTTLTGLTLATTVQVRYRAVTKAGEGDWSQPVAQVVS